MKKGLVGLILVVAIVGGVFGVKSCKLIGTGKTGIVYNYKYRKKHYSQEFILFLHLKK